MRITPFGRRPLDADAAYLALVQRFPLRPLRSEHDLDRAVALIDELLDRPDLTASEQDYLSVLGDLVEAYEDKHVAMPDASGVDVLRHLMAEHNLRQIDLAPLFGSKSIVSEVLSGKRPLALNHIRKLSERFGVPADVFIANED